MSHNSDTPSVISDSRKLTVGCNGRPVNDMIRAIVLTGIPVTNIDLIMPSHNPPPSTDGLKLEVTLAISEGDWLATGGRETYLGFVRRALRRLDKHCGTDPVEVGAPDPSKLKDGQVVVDTSTNPHTLMYRAIAVSGTDDDKAALFGYLGEGWEVLPTEGNRLIYRFAPSVYEYKISLNETRKMRKAGPDAGTDDTKVYDYLMPLSLRLAGVNPRQITSSQKFLAGMARVQAILDPFQIKIARTPVTHQLGGGKSEKMLYAPVPGPMDTEKEEKFRDAGDKAYFIHDLLCNELKFTEEQCFVKKTNNGMALVFDVPALLALGDLPAPESRAAKPGADEPADVTGPNGMVWHHLQYSPALRTASVVVIPPDEKRRRVTGNGAGHSHADRLGDQGKSVERPEDKKPQLG